MNLQNICNDVCMLTKHVAEYIKNERSNISNINFEIKGDNDFVTHVDKNAEKKIIEGLSKIIPEAGFIAEEHTSFKKGNIYNWIIDPIDGTTNFIHGFSPNAISIALQRNNDLILGVVHEMGLNEQFYAYEDSKAYCNGNEISVSKTKTVKESLVATGFPYNDFSKQNEFIESMIHFMHHSHGLRRIGSAATDLVYVACGRFDSFYEYSLSPWDVAAGAFILKQAGGKVSDFSGGNNFLFGKEIIATNHNTYDEFLSVIKKYLA